MLPNISILRSPAFTSHPLASASKRRITAQFGSTIGPLHLSAGSGQCGDESTPAINYFEEGVEKAKMNGVIVS